MAKKTEKLQFARLQQENWKESKKELESSLAQFTLVSLAAAKYCKCFKFSNTKKKQLSQDKDMYRTPEVLL